MTGSSVYLHEDSGYTLIELLVAIAILALLVTPISGSIVIGLSTWKNSQEFAQQQERIFLLRQRFENWFLQAYPLDISRKNLHGERMLLGDSQHLEFSTAIHPDPLQNALYRVRIRLQEDVLQIATLPDFAYQEDGANWVWNTVVENIDTLSLDYMLGRDVNDQSIWLSDWGNTAETTYLPLAIRMRLSMKDKKLLWPDLIVPLKVEEQAYCVFLVNERTCKAGASIG